MALPEREIWTILAMAACGYTYAAIADKTGCAPRTVQTYVRKGKDQITILSDFVHREQDVLAEEALFAALRGDEVKAPAWAIKLALERRDKRAESANAANTDALMRKADTEE